MDKLARAVADQVKVLITQMGSKGTPGEPGYPWQVFCLLIRLHFSEGLGTAAM